jgi:hypothetical protein
MFCPECGSEYRDGFTRCADCDVELLHERPTQSDAPVKLVNVFETADPALIPVVESLLLGEGIAFFARNENRHDMFAGGRFGGGVSHILGPVEFLVREEDVPAARSLLADLAGSVAEVTETDE